MRNWMRLIAVPIVLASGSAALAQGTVFARLALNGTHTLALPLAFDAGTQPDPAYRVQDESGQALMEWVPRGQTVEGWNQMQTLTVHANLRTDNPDASVEALLRALQVNYLSLYIRGCTTAPVAHPLAVADVVGSTGVMGTYVGCPAVTAGDHSEEMAFVVFLDDTHGYSLQWAERGAPRAALPVQAATVWNDRAAHLAQVALCDDAPRTPACR